jgi:hypothetical protein
MFGDIRRHHSVTASTQTINRMARPQVADEGTAFDMKGSCEYSGPLIYELNSFPSAGRNSSWS